MIHCNNRQGISLRLLNSISPQSKPQSDFDACEKQGPGRLHPSKPGQSDLAMSPPPKRTEKRARRFSSRSDQDVAAGPLGSVTQHASGGCRFWCDDEQKERASFACPSVAVDTFVGWSDDGDGNGDAGADV